MCVIMVADGDDRPTEAMINQGNDHNPAGAGIAWREELSNGDVVINWRKGIKDINIIQDLARSVPLPFVVHFRIPTVGGPLKCLTHPFPIEHHAPLNLQGQTKSPVLFHNGNWNGWRSNMLDMAIRGLWTIPQGAWSDTRAMALIASHLGIGWLDFLNEKIVVFGLPSEESIDGIDYLGNVVPIWPQVEGVTCSNDFFCQRWKEVRNHSQDERSSSQTTNRFDRGTGGPQTVHRFPVIDADDEDEKATSIIIDPGPFRQRLGGDATENPFVPKRNRKNHKNALWRSVRTLEEAHRMLALGHLSKNQYKKALKMLEEALPETNPTKKLISDIRWGKRSYPLTH